MAESKRPKRSHVSGFVKGLKDNLEQKVVTFKVGQQKFILPQISTFTTAIRVAHLSGWNILVLFDANGDVHPRITGVITKPLWKQVSAASEGETYEDVRAICPNGRPL